MTITIKTADEIEKMRVAGKLASEVLEMITPYVQPGVTTNELNDRCHDYIVNVQDAIPAPLNYKGFPKSICTSINQQICHGIPSDKKLKSGDIVNIDVTIIKNGYHGDTSKMFLVGKPTIQGKRISELCQQALYKGIQILKPDIRLGDIGAVIQNFAHANGLSVVREFCGHGIGKGFHEDPQVLHYGEADTGETLEPGMCFTIEPMLNAGKRHIKMLSDNWTAVTKDRSLSAQWEHTLLITATGYEILTLRAEETVARCG